MVRFRQVDLQYAQSSRWHHATSFQCRLYEVDDLNEDGELHEVVAWCLEQFGPFDAGHGDWWRTRQVFSFIRDDHAFAFRMRWC